MSRSKADPSDRSNERPTASVAPGPDFLQLDIGQAPPRGRTDWLTGRLRQAVADGRLPVGSRLPAGRALAEELRVSRGVVTEAYRRLAESGQTAGRGRHGTIVVAAPTAPTPPPARGEPDPARRSAPGPGTARTATRPRPPVAPTRLRAAATGTGSALAIEELRSLDCRFDLAPGVPDLAAFPRTAWLRAERAALTGLDPAAFGYGDPQGTPALRRAVTDWLARNRGVRADPAEVVVVAGVAQGLALLAGLLREEGIDRIAVEDPGSLGGRRQLEAHGMTTEPVPVDAAGLDVAALRAGGARAVLTTPAHQFPTGAVLGGDRRRELLAWAEAGGLVIEDDYDAEHRYDRPAVPALKSLLPERVCYAGSVSKLLAPALRIGWLLVPEAYRERLVHAKRYADLGNAALPQLALARLMESGDLERHLRHVRRRHRRRRDALLTAMADRLPGATVRGAAAGLHLTVTFDGAFSDVDLAGAALARGVKTHPLSWHRVRPGPPGLVLGYAATPPADFPGAVAALADAHRGVS
ncbi:PLP-dependent aminotransferase family protein [Streptomyces sp. NPDC097619]|uniref:MocR-like pyridoxine biosynthesis transcription factor PdxR n=1 Tax=Streptomyces sp. NPDC097619 TaxID=3157228 RepID=UPI0033289AA7